MVWFFRASIACTIGVAVLFSGVSRSQDASSAFPSRPVAVILSTAPGGPNDFEARLYTTKMSALFGQPFVLDFKVGAGGTIGNAYVAKARPDGYTLLVVSGNFTTSPALYDNLPYDTVKDFAPVSLMSKRISMLMVNLSFPAKNMSEYVAYAKANPGKINFGTSGAGSTQHLLGAWLNSATGTKATLIHYKGTAPLILDIQAGRVDVSPTALVVALPLIRAGKTRALVLMNDQRAKLMPDLQTVVEQGMPGYNYAGWLGFSSPAATPVAIVNKLSEGLAKVAKMADVAAPLEAEGSVMVGSTPAQFRQLIAGEVAQWRRIVQENGIKLEE